MNIKYNKAKSNTLYNERDSKIKRKFCKQSSQFVATVGEG